MRILVTGGAGYIGSHCASLLQGQVIETVVFDNLEHGYRVVVPDLYCSRGHAGASGLGSRLQPLSLRRGYALCRSGDRGRIRGRVCVLPSGKEVIDVCRWIAGRSKPVRVYGCRVGDPAALVASNKKIQQELGWHPECDSLEAILETAWRWHQQPEPTRAR